MRGTAGLVASMVVAAALGACSGSNGAGGSSAEVTERYCAIAKRMAEPREIEEDSPEVTEEYQTELLADLRELTDNAPSEIAEASQQRYDWYAGVVEALRENNWSYENLPAGQPFPESAVLEIREFENEHCGQLVEPVPGGDPPQ